MAKQLVSDELWAAVEPLLPAGRPPGTPGHPRVPDRVAAHDRSNPRGVGRVRVRR